MAALTVLQNSSNPTGKPLCRHLRAKGMFIEVEFYAAEEWIPDMTTGFVWCVHSQNCMGPDGSVAERETCVSGRACYEV